MNVIKNRRHNNFHSQKKKCLNLRYTLKIARTYVEIYS